MKYIPISKITHVFCTRLLMGFKYSMLIYKLMTYLNKEDALIIL